MNPISIQCIYPLLFTDGSEAAVKVKVNRCSGLKSKKGVGDSSKNPNNVVS
jgi:hypothetical protein